MPGQFPVEGNGVIYIEPPKNSKAQLTRVYVNMGIWSAVLHSLGYANRLVCPIFEWLDTSYANNKVIDGIGLINALSAEGFSPVGYQDDVVSMLEDIGQIIGAERTNMIFRVARLLWDLISKMLLLKIFELVRQQISEEDYKFETKYIVFYPQMPDEQFKQQLDVLNNAYNVDSVRVPRGSLGHKKELKIFPFTTNQSTGYRIDRINADVPANLSIPQTQTVGGRAQLQHDSSEYEGIPAVGFCEVRFDMIAAEDPNHTGLTYTVEGTGVPEGALTNGRFLWVDIQLVTAVEAQQAASFNRITGDLTLNNEESTVIFSIVYPTSLNMIPPITNAMAFEQRHWPLIYKWFLMRNPIIQVPTRRESKLYNQASIYGPRSYLVNTSYLAPRTGFTVDDYRECFRTCSSIIAAQMFPAQGELIVGQSPVVR